MFESLTASLQKVFSRWGKDRFLTEANIREGLEEIRKALLEADVHFQVARDLIARVGERAVGEATIRSIQPAQQVIKVFQDVLTEAMQGDAPKLPLRAGAPAVAMLVGLQGSGKTTTVAKLARHFSKQGRRPLMVAADVRRPAAIRQLQVLGERLGIPVFARPGEAPPRICAAAVAEARQTGHDVVLLDTAGRLHIDAELMQELEDVARETRPDVTYLVCDSMAGQDAYTSAEAFHGRLGLDALILTKLDGDARGGAAISVRMVTGKPVAYVGVGERLEDLTEFHADRMASRILGMGDVVSLVEKAQEVMDQESAEEAAERLLKAQFTFHDFLAQLRALRRMGPLGNLFKMLPGGLGQAFSQSGVDEREMARVEAVILSMTEDERQRPDVIDASRKRRIARGSGTDVSHVNQLLRQFDQLRQMMKNLGGGLGMGKLGKMFGGALGGRGGGGPMPALNQAELLGKLRGAGDPSRGGGKPPATRKQERKRQKQARKRNRKRG